MKSKEIYQPWTLIGAVIDRLGGRSNLSQGDILIITKVIDNFKKGFSPPKSDTRSGPDFQEADAVLVFLNQQYGFNIDSSDENRRRLVSSYAHHERSIGNAKSANDLFSALLNKGRTKK
jgi:hypothetical protein